MNSFIVESSRTCSNYVTKESHVKWIVQSALKKESHLTACTSLNLIGGSFRTSWIAFSFSFLTADLLKYEYNDVSISLNPFTNQVWYLLSSLRSGQGQSMSNAFTVLKFSIYTLQSSCHTLFSACRDSSVITTKSKTESGFMFLFCIRSIRELMLSQLFHHFHAHYLETVSWDSNLHLQLLHICRHLI